MPFVQGTTTQARRYACDRCHSQKLRCPRPAEGNDLNEPCVRCRKAGASCNVSATLKTGRPSKAVRLQARLEAYSNSLSSRTEQLSTSRAPSTPPIKDNSNASAESGQEETSKLFRDAIKNHTSQISSSSVSSSAIQTPTEFEATSMAMVMDDNFELLDLDMDFLDTIDRLSAGQCFDKTEDIPEWNYMIQPNIHIPMPNSAGQPNFLQQESIKKHDYSLDPPLPDSPAHQTLTLLDNSTVIEDAICSSPFPAYMTPGETPSVCGINQETGNPDRAIQGISPGALDMRMTGETPGMTFSSPSSCSTFLYQDNPSHSGWCSQPAKGISMTSGLGDRVPEMSQTYESKYSRTILQLQFEIYDCSGKIIYPRSIAHAFESADQQRQSRSESLGKLFCTAEKFIKFIVDFSRSPPTCSSPPNPPSIAVPSTVKPTSTGAMDQEHNYYSTSSKPGASSPALGPFGQEISDTVTPSESRFPDAATFHLIMACYTRLLTAYDVIIETIAGQLPCPSNLSHGPCSPIGTSFSIGDFTVHSGTFLESLVHLQVISHQLGRLGDALYRYLLLSQPPRQTENFSTASLRRPYQARCTTGPPTTMGDSAMEMVEEQEMALKAKIAKIRDSARESHMF